MQAMRVNTTLVRGFALLCLLGLAFWGQGLAFGQKGAGEKPRGETYVPKPTAPKTSYAEELPDSVKTSPAKPAPKTIDVRTILEVPPDAIGGTYTKPPAKPGDRVDSKNVKKVTVKFDDKPPTLDEALAAALKNNPAVVRAELNLRTAQSELNLARLQVAQEVTAAFTALHMQQDQAKRIQKLFESGNIATEAATGELAKLQEAQSKFNQLLGRFPENVELGLDLLWTQDRGDLALGSEEDHREWPTGKVAEKLREVLNKATEVNFNETSLEDCLVFLKDSMNVNILLEVYAHRNHGEQSKGKEKAGVLLEFEQPVTMQLSGEPLAAILQALEDLHAVKFFVRDYGILATVAANPVDAVTVRDFLNRKTVPVKKDAPAERR